MVRAICCLSNCITSSFSRLEHLLLCCHMVYCGSLGRLLTAGGLRSNSRGCEVERWQVNYIVNALRLDDARTLRGRASLLVLASVGMHRNPKELTRSKL